MPLPVGDKLGPYEILSPIGAGGMGEVYRARDPRLRRDVALKILREEIAADPDRRARFEREARAVAALSHPNIVALYDIGEESGRLYMVSELVSGETLRDRLGHGALTTRETLDIAIQIAAGIAAAHEAGITHRDLKPENIMLASGKTVKILDFGLARLEDEMLTSASDTTVTVHYRTEPGIVMGTPNYMSPEQVRGRVTDFRSDQFSFGIMLHEMLTGKPAFRRDSMAETMTAILKEDAPPLDAVPAPLRWIVERTLAKDPDDRYASTKDLYRDLLTLRERLSGLSPSAAIPSIAPPPPRFRRLFLYGLAAGTLIAGGALLGLLTASRSASDESRYKFTAMAYEEPDQTDARWSPDGKSILYLARIKGVYQVLVRTVGARNAAQLTHARRDCATPFWSPDGSTAYYLSGGSWWAIGASGGVPQPAFQTGGITAIHPDGKTLAVVRNRKLFIGPADPNQQKEYRHSPFPADSQFLAIEFSPDGSQLAVVLEPVISEAGQSADLWVLPWQSDGVPRKTGKTPRLRAISWFPDSRHVLFNRDDGAISSLMVLDTRTDRTRVLWTAPGVVESCSVAPDGTRIALTLGERRSEVVEISLPDGRLSTLLSLENSISSNPDWAPSGTHYLYTTGSPPAIEDRSVTDGLVRPLVTVQSDGIPSNTVAFQSPRWSPDGQRVAFNLGFGGGLAVRQLWIANLSGGRPFPLSGARYGWAPVWSPDGEWLAYISLGDKPHPGDLLSRIRLSAEASPELIADDLNAGFLCWSPAGDSILYGSRNGLVLVSPDGKTRRTLTSRQMSAAFSKRGDQVYGIFQDLTEQGPILRLVSIDVKSGVEKQLATLDPPPDATVSRNGLTLHPDGNRLAVSLNHRHGKIYTLDGLDQPASWVGRLLRKFQSL